MNPLAFSAVLLLAVGAMAQYRPFYAGGGVNYPRPFGSSSSNSDDGLADRFGGTDLASRIDANGHDTKLVEDAAKLPAEQQPFWYLNRELINRHIGLRPTGAAGTLQTVQPVQPVQPVQTLQPFVNVVQPVQGLPIHPVETLPDPATNVA